MNQIVYNANGWKVNAYTKLLVLWRYKTERAADAQYRACSRRRDFERVWGAANICAAIAVLGASVIDQKLDIESLSIWVIGLGVASVVSSAAQALLNYRDEASGHKDAAISYSNIGRDIELMFSNSVEYEDLERLCARLNDLNQMSPVVPASIFRSGQLSKIIGKIEGAKDDLMAARAEQDARDGI